MKKILLTTMCTTLLTFAGGDMVDEPIEEVLESPVEQSSEWEQSLSIYGWLPTLNGTMKFELQGGSKEETESNAIDGLDAVFMGSYEIRKNKWSFLADFIYLKMSGDTPGKFIPNVNYNTELTAKLFSFYGGYTLSESNNMQIDMIGGMRYLGLGLDVTRSGSYLPILNGTVSPSAEHYDAVIGIKGKYTINENWYVPYLFDIGAGDSALTWQANASLAYRFGWGDVIATYRYIHYEKENSLLIKDFNLYGPKLGVVFHF